MPVTAVLSYTVRLVTCTTVLLTSVRSEPYPVTPPAELYINALPSEPASPPTTTATDLAVEYCSLGGEYTHTTDDAETQAVVRQDVPPMAAIAPDVDAPKFCPVMVTLACPMYGPLTGDTVKTVGGSYANAPTSVPIRLLTLAVMVRSLPAAAGTVHTSAFVPTESTIVLTPPIWTTGVSPVNPRLIPWIVISEPPAVGPFTGVTDNKTGASYVNFRTPTAYPLAPRDMLMVASIAVPAGDAKTTILSDFHVTAEAVVAPSKTVALESTPPKLRPCSVTSSPPAMGPF